MNAGPSSIEVLRRQELSRNYRCSDYLAAGGAVTESIRAEMLDWVCKSTSYMKMNEDIPSYTATLLDRFLQTQQGSTVLECVPEFRLATMGCLYLTAKIHDPCVVISPKVMSAFSQGMFTAEEVEDMEVTILTAMEWYTNPPTALAFVREFLLLLPSSVSASTKEQACELCQAQIQRCMLDYKVFALKEASTIAFFAVQNALATLGMDSITLGHVAAIFSYSTHTDFLSQPENEELVLTSLSGGNDSLAQPQQQLSKKTRRRSTKGRRLSNSSSSSTSSRRSSWSRRSMSLDESPCGVVLERSR